MRKTILFVLAAACAGMTLSCNKATAVPSSASAAPRGQERSSELRKELPPELQKLHRVLSGMSERAKAAIPNGNPNELLADLRVVLETEAAFRADDLSLYRLIDKTHPVAADYVPKDLIPVTRNELWNVNRNDLSLRPEAYHALEDLARAALQDGITLLVSSTYRSYAYQERLFARYVREDGLVPGRALYRSACSSPSSRT